MKGQRPFMLLRARARPDHAAEFERWFDGAHLRDVGGIPGIVDVYGTRTPGSTAGGTRLGVYVFESAAAVQEALGSAEAAYARGTWNTWMPRLEEIQIEIFAPVVTMSLYESPN